MTTVVDALGRVQVSPKEKDSQALLLVRLAIDHYQLGRAEDDEPFATPIAGPKIVRLMRGGRSSLRADLGRRFYADHGKVPSSSALADAMNVLDGLAMLEPRCRLHVRVARENSITYIDLGDETGNAIALSKDGWRIVEQPPTMFRRTEAMLPLPHPISGGGIGVWRELLNLPGEDELALLLSWLVALLYPDIPHPVLIFTGPQGAAKSTNARIISSVVDPSSAQLRSAPRDLTDWIVAAAGSYVVAIDNVSRIPEWLSDAMCRASTGDGLVRRALYTDNNLSVVSFRRAVIVTSIDPGALRGDLADRLLAVQLDEIPEERRRLDGAVTDDLARAAPVLLGSVLDLAVHTLAHPKPLARKPRMADYGDVLASVDAALGTRGVDVYLEQRDRLQRDVADSDAVAVAIIGLVSARGLWRGTATELLEAISPERPVRDWPRTPRALSGHLGRLGLPLRAAGVAMSLGDRLGHKRTRMISLEMAGNDRPHRPQSEQAPDQRVLDQQVLDGADDADGADAKIPVISVSRAPSRAERPLVSGDDLVDPGEREALEPVLEPVKEELGVREVTR